MDRSRATGLSRLKIKIRLDYVCETLEWNEWIGQAYRARNICTIALAMEIKRFNRVSAKYKR
jgi:hypothetical protein